MSVYYNEIDPKKAAWLRELIAADIIAQGIVDERSITDVQPVELAGYTQCHFFAGIGIWSYALRLAGWPDDQPVWTGSCPCQPFSVAGKKEGTQDKRHLWPDWFRLITQCRPVVVFGEQVADGDGITWLDNVHSQMESIRYRIGACVLPASGFGAPHGRHRTFFVADTKHPNRGPEHEIHQRGYRGVESQSGQGIQMCKLAHTELNGRRPDEQGRRSQGREADGRDSANGQLAHPNGGESPVHARQGTGPGEANGSGSHTQPAGRSQTQCVGHTQLPDRGTEQQAGSTQCGRSRSGRDDADDGLDHPERTGLEGRTRHGQDGNQSGRQPEGSHRPAATPGLPGPVNGFWADAEWIPTRGKIPGTVDWRPIEPGTFPLVNGSAERILRLRGYGDGIVAHVAKEFIKAYLQIQNTKT